MGGIYYVISTVLFAILIQSGPPSITFSRCPYRHLLYCGNGSRAAEDEVPVPPTMAFHVRYTQLQRITYIRRHGVERWEHDRTAFDANFVVCFRAIKPFSNAKRSHTLLHCCNVEVPLLVGRNQLERLHRPRITYLSVFHIE